MEELAIGDLYALSALRTEGFEPVRAAQDGHRVAWIFRATPELRATLSRFYARSMQVDALSFAEAIRSAKGEAMNLRAASAVC